MLLAVLGIPLGLVPPLLVALLLLFELVVQIVGHGRLFLGPPRLELGGALAILALELSKPARDDALSLGLALFRAQNLLASLVQALSLQLSLGAVGRHARSTGNSPARVGIIGEARAVVLRNRKGMRGDSLVSIGRFVSPWDARDDQSST